MRQLRPSRGRALLRVTEVSRGSFATLGRGPSPNSLMARGPASARQEPPKGEPRGKMLFSWGLCVRVDDAGDPRPGLGLH